MENKKHVIVTGATSGIGEVTAIELAKAGFRVIMINRNEEKSKATVAKIKEKTNSDADYLIADFSSTKSTQAAIKEYLDRYDRLDILINNAGTFLGSRKENDDGLEMHIAVNHIAPFVLTNGLLDLIKQTAADTGNEGRIVNVASDLHYKGVNWGDMQFNQSYDMQASYGQSKAMNVMFTHALAKRLEGSNITVNALHPGVVATGIFDGFGESIFSKLFVRIFKIFLISPEKGALTTLYLAQSDEVAGVTGKYFANQKQKKALSETLIEDNWEKIWSMTEAWAAG